MEKGKYKICFVGVCLNNGGIGRAVSILANELSKTSQYDITIISYIKPDNKDFYELSSKIHREYLLDEYKSMLKLLLTDGFVRLCSILKKRKITHVIGCGVLYFPLVTIAARLLKIKSICWEHTNPETSSDLRFQKIIRFIGAKTSTANVLISKEGLNYYNKYLCKNKNYLIYNSTNPQQKKFIKSYNNESKKIISVGRLTDAKDYTRLIKIAGSIFKIHPDWCWDIYGEGELQGILEDQIKALNLVGKVVLKGNVSNIYEIYNQYSFQVMTSKFEGFPMVLIEGATAGLPLIAFDIESGPNEIIQNGVNGFLCDKNSNEEMISAILKLIENRELRIQCSINCKKMISDFNIDNICNKWNTLIFSI